MHIQASHQIRQTYCFASTKPKTATSTEGQFDNGHAVILEQDTQPRKLLLIEDHLAMVDGMMPKLQQRHQVAVVNSLPTMCEAIEQNAFSLAIVDLTLLGQTHGLGMMPILRDANINFLVFSGTADEWHIRAAARMGALGYVDKRDGLAKLHEAIAAIEAGEIFFPDGLMEKLAADPELQFPKKLGTSEIGVMDKLFEMTVPGTTDLPSNKEISEVLHICPRRVTNIFNQLFAKFNITDGRKALFEELKKRGYFPGILLGRQKKRPPKK
jgi:DNA-binding NarL/FixJ family response regulator